MHAGDAVGLVHIMDVPRDLKRRRSTESKALTAMVQREVARIEWLAAHAPPAASVPTQVFASARPAGLPTTVSCRKHCRMPMHAGQGPRAVHGCQRHAEGSQEVTAGPAGGRAGTAALHCQSVMFMHWGISCPLLCPHRRKSGLRSWSTKSWKHHTALRWA